jgi:hypothetical protein
MQQKTLTQIALLLSTTWNSTIGLGGLNQTPKLGQ